MTIEDEYEKQVSQIENDYDDQLAGVAIFLLVVTVVLLAFWIVVS